MAGFLQDLRYGFRLLLKSPGFTAAAVATLALGIGATTAISSVIASVLLKPLPYPDAERVVMVWDSKPSRGWDTFTVSPGNYVDYEAGQRSFEAMAALDQIALVLTGQGEPEKLDALMATPDLVGIIGAAPALGRVFRAEEYAPGASHVVIMTDAIWKRRFGGRADTLGSTVTLDGVALTVIGILPPEQSLPAGAEVLVPLFFNADQRARHGGHYLLTMARLKPGVSVEAAEQDLRAIAARMEKELPDTNAGWTANVVSLEDEVVGDVRPALYALAGAVACLLLLACANVANLILARSATRRTEIALRAALGAGRGRLLRQLLTESLLLSLAGGVSGVLLGWWGVDLIRVFRPGNLPRIDGLQVDGRVLLVALGIAVASGLLFGTISGLLLARARLAGTLQEAGRGLRGRMSQRVRATLVSAQVALALVLLVGTGLQIRSLERLLRVDPGFDATNVLMMEMALPVARYPDRPSQRAFFEKVVEGLRGLPGVRGADAVSVVPSAGANILYSFQVEGKPLSPDQSVSANYYAVTPGYFETMGIPLIAGRWFDAHDNATAQNVMIVNDALAKRMFPGEDPIGRRLEVTFDRPPRTIVGVVGNVRQYGLDGGETMQMYDPVAQFALDESAFVIRAGSDPGGLASAVRGVVSAADPEMAVSGMRTLDEVLAASTAERRFSLALLGVFAFCALVLAAVGVYGVVAYGVSQRTHEIGVRMALGAGREAILGLVLRQGMLMVLVGIAAGLLGALALTRVIQGLLFGIGALDPATYLVTAAVMSLVAFVATYLPARRATRVEPTAALRCE